MKSLHLFFAFVFTSLLAVSTPVFAQDEDEAAIKQRLMERVDEIDELKLAGKVGENNVGLLEQRAPLSREETELMNAENSDRRALYTLIGKRLGLTQSVVGQGRAEELRRKSAPGVWVQDRSGKWFQKE